MTEVNGWHLPGKDSYFTRFVLGAPRKSNGFQREHLQKAFEFVSAWDVALDIGAHVGFWTRDMAERFAKVYAFEPAEDCYQCLVNNTEDLPNVLAKFAGVGRNAGTCRVEDDPDRPGNTGSRYIRPQGGVPLLTVDGLGLKACDFMKVDVEGAELSVLEGAQETIAAFRPVIIMECHKSKKFASTRFGVEDRAAEHWLLERGYKEVAHMRPDKVFALA